MIEALVDNPEVQMSGVLAALRIAPASAGLPTSSRSRQTPSSDPTGPGVEADLTQLYSPAGDAMAGSHDYLLTSHFADLCTWNAGASSRPVSRPAHDPGKWTKC